MWNNCNTHTHTHSGTRAWLRWWYVYRNAIVWFTFQNQQKKKNEIKIRWDWNGKLCPAVHRFYSWILCLNFLLRQPSTAFSFRFYGHIRGRHSDQSEIFKRFFVILWLHLIDRQLGNEMRWPEPRLRFMCRVGMHFMQFLLGQMKSVQFPLFAWVCVCCLNDAQAHSASCLDCLSLIFVLIFIFDHKFDNLIISSCLFYGRHGNFESIQVNRNGFMTNNVLRFVVIVYFRCDFRLQWLR